MKGRYCLISTVACLALMFCCVLPAFAANSVPEEKLHVGLRYLWVESDYSEAEAYVEYDFTTEVAKAIVRNRSTHEILEIYEESVTSSGQSSGRSVNDYTTLNFSKQFNPTSDSMTMLRATVEAYLYRENIAGATSYSIVSINDCWVDLVGSGPFELESNHASVQGYTTKSCTVNASGVYKATKSTAVTAGVTYEHLENLKFNFSASETQNWIARLPYQDTVTITIY